MASTAVALQDMLGIDAKLVRFFLLLFALNFSPILQHVIPSIPCSMKFVRDFYFEDWRFFEVYRNKFLRLQLTEISAGMELIFAGGFLFEQQNINNGSRIVIFSTFITFFKVKQQFILLRHFSQRQAGRLQQNISS